MTKKINFDDSYEHFKTIISQQEDRIKKIKTASDWIDFEKKSPIVIGVCFGDGIGELICKQTLTILNVLLKDELINGKIQIKTIEGLTIENRVKHNQSIPTDVLAEIKRCDVLLKGPTTTPQRGGPWPNIESANVSMRRELDLFANIRPVKVPAKNIEWYFFRENTEGEYVLGSQGLTFNDFCVDFKITTRVGTERICRAAFEFAKRNNKKRVTIVTKSNIMKATDGLFSEVANEVAKDYESYSITCDEYYIDIMTANLINDQEASKFEVMVLPNLYGDILSDQAGQIQGGVGTAGSANIGKRYSMFEAIHGSAPRLIEEGLGDYANPASIMRAACQMLDHIGLHEKARRFEYALDVTSIYEKQVIVDPKTKTKAFEYTQYVLSWLERSDLETIWKYYTKT
jgi:isocitrate dehydrogenase (NAD+)